MPEPFALCVGGIVSADIAVPDHERVLRFYSRVLTTGETPLWREDLMNNHGMPIVGLGARTAEYAHLPLQWMPHIQVAGVGDSVKHALDHGGKVLMQAKDDQWAVLLDPNGAAFGVIPVVSPDALPAAEGAAAGPVGRIAWLDLTVSNATATRDFYTQVVGWSVQDTPMKDGDTSYADYTLLASNESAVAGVCHARGVNQKLPPVWLIYLPVGDLAESLRRVAEEGGKVVSSCDGDSACAVIQDPVGAYLALARA